MANAIQTSSAHTPGSWNLQPSAGNHDFMIYDVSTGKDIALVRNFHEGNARLISAAPQLFEVCKRLRDDPNMDDTTAIQLLNEVITKVEGR